jgi:hypothetical protein
MTSENVNTYVSSSFLGGGGEFSHSGNKWIIREYICQRKNCAAKGFGVGGGGGGGG